MLTDFLRNIRIGIICMGCRICYPCAQMHKRIGALLKEMQDRVCVQYIFSSFNKELEVSARFLIAVYQQEESKRAEAIYGEWFAGKKYLGETYIMQFGYDLESEAVNQELSFSPQITQILTDNFC